jgi:cytochrome P450
VARLTEELFTSSVLGKPAFDLIADFAMPLPVTVIAQMLGVDPQHMSAFKRWSDDMVAVRSVAVHKDEAWRRRREREIVQSSAEFSAYFDDVIAQRREAPGDDLISAIVQAADEGQIIKGDEILSLTRLMLVAGNETTTNLLGNAMTALLRHPDQWRKLTEDPSLVTNAVEEALRFDGPVIQLARRVAQPTEIAGTPLPEGTFIAPLVSSANRDPRRFPDPDRFDLDRDASGHLAFGLGIHLCVGAPLARIETRLALAALAREMPDLALTDAPAHWLDSLTLRGHKSLPLVRRSTQTARSAAPERATTGERSL